MKTPGPCTGACREGSNKEAARLPFVFAGFGWFLLVLVGFCWFWFGEHFGL
jgi:hypothetical protein